MLTKTVETTTTSRNNNATTKQATTTANGATTTAPRQAQTITDTNNSEAQQMVTMEHIQLKLEILCHRIAVNHGMDVATLKQINGLTGDNIAPGTTLKVAQ